MRLPSTVSQLFCVKFDAFIVFTGHDIGCKYSLQLKYRLKLYFNKQISISETVKSKVIISSFETVRLSVKISPRNIHNSLKDRKSDAVRLI